MGRTDYKIIVAIFLCTVSFFSCKKDTGIIKAPDSFSERKVLVVCEGSYGNGNAELDLYEPNVDSFFQNIYQSVNGNSLGDIFQSVQKIGNNYYLCINNSDKIIVTDTAFKLISYISVPKPRYILQVATDKAYVSSLYHHQVYVINTLTNNLTDSISLSGKNSEGMLLYNNSAFICTWDTSVNKIYNINSTNNIVSDSFYINGFAPKEILLDKEDKLWILSGNIQSGKVATLSRIDPSTNQILKTFTFPNSADPIRPVMNSTKDSIYFIEANYNGGTDYNGIYRMAITATDLPQQAFIQAQTNQYFWSLGIDPLTGNIYVGDPKGFVQKGSVSIYQQDGTKLKQFATGVGPGHFYFTN